MSDINTVAALEQKFQHIYHTRPILNFHAMFADGSPYYLSPMEPEAGEEIRIRFRTGRENAEHVYVCYGKEEQKEMAVASHDELFDFYETTIIMPENTLEYYFRIQSAGIECFYNKRGPVRELDPFFNYKVTPGFATPDWAKGAVFYQIYVERFANGDPTNDVTDREYVYINQHVQHVDNWGEYPTTMDVRRFYGGDLQGVLDHLDYLKDLGVDVIYLNPIFVSPSNHKYDIQDYDYVDPHFGKIVVDEGEALEEWVTDNSRASRYISRVTDKRNLEASNQFFAHFVEEVHARGMRVILDGVFNHCGSFNKWMDAERIYEGQPGYEKGAYVSADSPYRDYFKFFHEEGWPYNDDYDGWWGHKTLPKLNYEESRQLYDYVMKIGRKWVSPPYNVDGWRLDVAADLGHSGEFNHQFWREFRTEVKDANPEAIIIAEHYGDPGDWLAGDQWDTIMNYSAFMEPITWFLTGMEKHSDERRGDLIGNVQAFWDAMVYYMSRFQHPSLMVSMNELSNHDHSRFLTRTNQTVGRIQTLGPEAANQGLHMGTMRSAVLMQMSWPGAPTLYYGDEAGMTGWTDPDNRRTYPWGHEDQELIRYHQDMIRIHKSHEALMHGSLKMIRGGIHTIAYGRFTDDERIVALINIGLEEEDLHIPVWEIGVTDDQVMNTLVFNREYEYSLTPQTYPVENGIMYLHMPILSAILLIASDPKEEM